MSLKLLPSELYYDGEIIQFNDGSLAMLREPLNYENSVNDRFHTVQDEDNLDRIAWQYYRNKVEHAEQYWWVIAEVNDIPNPFDISGLSGQQILIPDILKIQLER